MSSCWACHRGCHDYTHWRVVEEDQGKIPGHEIPQGWAGFEEKRLENARAAYAKKMADLEK